MPEGDGPIEWDFLTLVSWWNYGALPIALVAATALVLLGPKLRGLSVKTDPHRDGRRILRLVALICLGQAARWAIALAQEILTFRLMGVTESFANFVQGVLNVLVNPPLALGLWRRWRAAWWFGIAWYLLLSVIASMRIRWQLTYQVAVDPIWWPSFAAGEVLPLFLLIAMFVPRTRVAFARKPKPGVIPDSITDVAPAEALAPAADHSVPRWSVFSVLALWFLIIVVSNVIVESADWIDRLIWPPE
jgi:hypothetical protein